MDGVVQRVYIPKLEQFVLATVEATGVMLGDGAYGCVEEVTYAGASCAAKRLYRETPRESQETELWMKLVHECMTLSKLHHPNIVQFYGICYFPGEHCPLLVMEHLGNSLDTLLSSAKNIHLDGKVSVLYDIACGLNYLHNNHTPPIIHCDLTAENILFNGGMVAKIIDFGKAHQTVSTEHDSEVNRAHGNMAYTPPEVLQKKASVYNTPLDVFSYGCLALFTLTQVFPEPTDPTYVDPRTQMSVVRSEVDRRFDCFQRLYGDVGKQHTLSQLVRVCLQNGPEQRPSVMKIVGQLSPLPRRRERIREILPIEKQPTRSDSEAVDVESDDIDLQTPLDNNVNSGKRL